MTEVNNTQRGSGKLRGATTIIAVETVPARMEMAMRVGADVVIDFHKTDPVEEIIRVTNGRGVDVAIEALGLQSTFDSCLKVLKPGGTLSINQELTYG